MEWVSAAVLALTIVAVFLMLWKGGTPERWAAVAVLIYLLAVPALEDLKVREWRLGVAAAETTLFFVFWILTERTERKWLAAAAAFQLISVVTFLIPWFVADYLVWTGVAFRLAAWTMVTATLFFSAYEAHIVRRYGLESDHGLA